MPAQSCNLTDSILFKALLEKDAYHFVTWLTENDDTNLQWTEQYSDTEGDEEEYVQGKKLVKPDRVTSEKPTG